MARKLFKTKVSKTGQMILNAIVLVLFVVASVDFFFPSVNFLKVTPITLMLAGLFLWVESGIRRRLSFSPFKSFKMNDALSLVSGAVGGIVFTFGLLGIFNFDISAITNLANSVLGVAFVFVIIEMFYDISK